MNSRHIYINCRNFFTNNLSATNKYDKATDYDIIVSGGGMIGSTLACVLSKNQLLKNSKILLIEGAKKKNWFASKSYSNRVSAINSSSRKLLESIGVWSYIEEARCKPVKQMKVWGCGSPAAIEFSSGQDSTNESITHIVENDVLLAGVSKQLDKLKDTVTVVHGSKVHQYQLPKWHSKNEGNSVRMEDGKMYSCQLLLGTDGVNSKVREAMGVKYINWSYHQSAVVATLHLEEVLKNETAWQRFLSTGPVALLPLDDNLSSLVWSTSAEDAKKLMQMTDKDFVVALNKALIKSPQSNSIIDFTSHVADIAGRNLKWNTITNDTPVTPPTITAIVEGSRASFPLGFGHSSCYVQPGVAILGDSAHRVHPLAGLGVNLGFGDVDTLNRLLSEAITNGDVINSYSMLKQYEKERLRQNLPTMLAIDLINKLFSNNNILLVATGHLAIQFANCIPPVKDFMIKQASCS